MRRIANREIIRDAYAGGQFSSYEGRYRSAQPDDGGRSGAGISGRIRAIREGLGLTKTAFAARIGVSQPTVTRWELNQDVPEERHLQRLATTIGISVSELRYGRTGLSEPAPVVGYVGPEAVVVPLQPERAEAELEQVTTLPGLHDPDILALRVRGNEVHPVLRDGWLVFYRRPQGGVPDDCIGQACVVRLADGRLLLREVRLHPSSPTESGPRAEPCFDLCAWGGRNDVLASQAVDWAAPVLGFRAP
jgi:transcriptional regulator with XRE-family HTH domain